MRQAEREAKEFIKRRIQQDLTELIDAWRRNELFTQEIGSELDEIFSGSEIGMLSTDEIRDLISEIGGMSPAHARFTKNWIPRQYYAPPSIVEQALENPEAVAEEMQKQKRQPPPYVSFWAEEEPPPPVLTQEIETQMMEEENLLLPIVQAFDEAMYYMDAMPEALAYLRQLIAEGSTKKEIRELLKELKDSKLLLGIDNIPSGIVAEALERSLKKQLR